MYARVSQLARHLSRPLPFYAHTCAAGGPHSSVRGSIMSSSLAEDRSKRTIHTAGCIIIGDEVLGGKVELFRPLSLQTAANFALDADG